MHERDRGRYRVIGPLGRGGTADVERIMDERLGRALARKRLRQTVDEAPERATRFAEEARLQARLQHPGVVPVHELGLDEQGRPAFTLAEVRGQTLGELISGVHRASTPAAWGSTEQGVGLRRLIEWLARAGEAIAYATAEGVVHRDLKPSNIMIGPFGELLVLDWGIALPVGDAPARAEGTPAYMPPEVARLERPPTSPALDIYGLGAVLYEILSGRPPHQGPTLADVISAARAGSPPPPGAPEGPTPPDALASLCQRCLSADPAQRPGSAAEVVAELRAWLDGAARREAARQAMELCRDRVRTSRALKAEAAEALEQARSALEGVQPWEPEERKVAGWALEDRAAALERAARTATVEAQDVLEAAIALDPERAEARAALADLHADALIEAEARGDQGAEHAARAALTRATRDLPSAAPQAPRWRALIEQHAWLSLETSPPGARVELERYEERGRRLVPVPVGSLGTAPLLEVPLPAGSYRLRLQREGHHEVLYPVRLGLGERWTAGPEPGAPWVIPLPPLGALRDDEVYVPAGPFLARHLDDGTSVRCWLHGFAIQTDPMTFGEWAAELNAMLDAGLGALGRTLIPMQSGITGTGEATPLLVTAPDGRLSFRDGDHERAKLPVSYITCHTARAFAEWLSASRGQRWRLMTPAHWTKASLGVDGRRYPQGDTLLAAWTWRQGSAPRVTGPVVSSTLVHDTSPYGVRGCSGNVRSWCEPEDGARSEKAWVVGSDWMQAIGGHQQAAPLEEFAHARSSVLGARFIRFIDHF